MATIHPIPNAQHVDNPRAPSCATCQRRPGCTEFRGHLGRFTDGDPTQDPTTAGLAVTMARGLVCDDFRTMFITYPITVEGITTEQAFDQHGQQLDVGRPVTIVLGADGYDDLVHLGMYLGQLPLSVVSAYRDDTRQLSNRLLLNPCVYVPRYARLFYGANTRWSFAVPGSLDSVCPEDRRLPEFAWAERWLALHGDLPPAQRMDRLTDAVWRGGDEEGGAH